MAKCTGCDREVIFIKDTKGKTQILDIQTPIWKVEQWSDGEPYAVRVAEVYVSHFSTCPVGSQFSKGKKRETQD